MKHLTILTPAAGNYSPREHDRIARALSGLEGKVIATPDLPSLDSELRRHQTYQPDILGIGGGDGTVSRTLTKIKEIWSYIPEYIATYALGTMNNVAIPTAGTDGLIDTMKRYVRIGKTKPVQLAQRIKEIVRSEEEFKTETLAPLNINGQWGFNAGFGMTAKLVWMYYGRTVEKYIEVQQGLQRISQGGYDITVNRLAPEKQEKSGTLRAAKTALDCVGALCRPSSPMNQFFNMPLEADIYIDGQMIHFPQFPTGIYIAAYEQQNIGVLKGIPLPRARAVPGQMEVMVSFAAMKDVLRSLPAIMRGKPMHKTEYIQARELKLKSGQVMIGQVDGEFVFGKEFVIRPDEPLKFISMR